MRYCSNCGNQLGDNAQFCQNCGAAIDKAENQPMDEKESVSNNINTDSVKKFISDKQQILKDRYSVAKEKVTSEYIPKAKERLETDYIPAARENAAKLKENISDIKAKTDKRFSKKQKLIATAVALVLVLFIGIKIANYVSSPFSEQAEDAAKTYRENAQKQDSQKTAVDKDTAILGTWVKATGVMYTFEEGGHISVSLSSNYDKSAGTSLDGSEVTTLLKQEEERGRIITGGQWKYVQTHVNEKGIKEFEYDLLLRGSHHQCVVTKKDGVDCMGVAVKSGNSIIGDVSVLIKNN